MPADPQEWSRRLKEEDEARRAAHLEVIKGGITPETWALVPSIFIRRPDSKARWGERKVSHKRAMQCFDRCVAIQAQQERNSPHPPSTTAEGSEGPGTGRLHQPGQNQPEGSRGKGRAVGARVLPPYRCGSPGDGAAHSAVAGARPHPGRRHDDHRRAAQGREDPADHCASCCSAERGASNGV